MRFTTLSFFIFFAAVYTVFWLLKGRQRLLFLIPASIAFYAVWSPFFGVHFAAIVVLNYLFVRYLLKQKKAAVFWVAVIINSVNLFFFKYFYLFLTVLHDITGLALFTTEQFNQTLETLTGSGSIILPLAISFYTFQILAFLIDTYRGQIKEDPGFAEYFLFILFFPQLVAGPIMRHTDFFEQIKSIEPKADYIMSGMFLILTGLIKKVLIADNLAAPVNMVFADPESYDSVSVAVAAAGYSARVYGDFSGYTDIARGTSLLLGISLPQNFAGPFLSQTMQEMWRRWHITLSTWLRDYLYIPMGGSRAGELRRNINLIITFTLGGLWHGASYTYVAWGFFHGVVLVAEGYIKKAWTRFKSGKRPKAADSAVQSVGTSGIILRKFTGTLTAVAGVIYAFTFFTFGVIFFNAPDIYKAFSMFAVLFSAEVNPDLQPSSLEQMIYGITVVFPFNWAEYKNYKFRLSPVFQFLLLTVYAAAVLILLTKFSPQGADFIYFQF